MTEQHPVDVIAARATVTLDAQALDQLAPATLDRLADIVAGRLAERRREAEAPLLTVAEAAGVAGVHPETVRRAIRSGALRAAGYAGRRPRLRRHDVEQWLTEPAPARAAAHGSMRSARRVVRAGARPVLGQALAAITNGGPGA